MERIYPPDIELKAFDNVFLAKGESRQIKLDIPFSRLRYYGQTDWEDGKGDYSIFIGRNAEEMIHQLKITL
jgi:hypothetical protein